MLDFYQSIHLAISDSASNFPEVSENFLDEFKQRDAIVPNNHILKLKEWQTYYLRFYSKELEQSVPGIFSQNDFSLTENSGTFISSKIGDIYIINFQNYVGLSRIGPVKIEISNRKINKKQYQSLLSYITRQYTNLVYQFSKTRERYNQGDISHTGYSTERIKVGKNLDFVNLLFLKQRLLDSSGSHSTISEIVNLILKEPHYKIQRDFVDTPVEQAAQIEPYQLINAVSNGDNLIQLRENHKLRKSALAIQLKHHFPVTIKQERKYHSFDTAENRFIKYFLDDLVQWLSQLKKRLCAAEKTYFNPEIEDDINQLYFPIKTCLDDPLWQEVSAMRFIPTNSQVLQRKEGYRQLLSLYSLMQLASHYNFNSFDFKNLLESKDTNILYEYWCFFILKDILDKLSGEPEGFESLVKQTTEQMNQEMAEGTWLYYQNNIQLGFNITFNKGDGSYSQVYRPDFIIKKNNEILIFDAKHKLQGWDDDYSKPKKEDIDKMHTYKDAINNAVGAFILYPGEHDVFYQYPGSKHQYEGVGGISLVPDDTDSDINSNNSIKQKTLVSLISQFTGLDNV